MENEAASQLNDYIMSPQVKDLLEDRNYFMHAHLVLIVGSRHILIWDMNRSEELVGTPYLVGKKQG